MASAIVLAVETILLALLAGAVGLFQRKRARHRERELQTELNHLARSLAAGALRDALPEAGFLVEPVLFDAAEVAARDDPDNLAVVHNG
jgi:hypothetical protein